MVKAVFLFFAAMLFIPGSAGADTLQTIKLDIYNILTGSGSGSELLYSGAGKAGIDFRSTGNRMVQGRLVIDAGISDSPVTFFDISRASVKFRFPVKEDYMFRVTAGKDRLTWGDGVYFNAGDVLYGSSTQNADFLGGTLRDETAWMISGFFPLGQFSFIETIVMPPQPDALSFADYLSGSSAEADSSSAAASGVMPGGPVSDSAAGFRLQFKPAGIKAEPGYLYRGEENTHYPYISLQGHMLADWYISASAPLDGNARSSSSLKDSAEEGFTLSFGLLHILKPDRDENPDALISLRLEALLRPWGEWDAASPSGAVSDADGSGGAAIAPRYGILLFPEIIWTPSKTVSAYFRTVFSPVDLSALIIPGVSWNIYQGFTMLSFLSVQAGEEDDLYSWENEGSITLTTGFSYIY